MDSENIALLLRTWNVTRDEADARLGGYRNTRVGEAQNPGPARQPKTCSGFSLFSLNCQSPNGACGFLDFCQETKAPLVVALQETRMSSSEEDAFVRHALKCGFHSQATPGLPDVGGRTWGGVLWLVDRRLRFRKSVSSVAEDAQVGALWVEDWFLLSFYSPPDHSRDAQMQASELLQQTLLAEDIPTNWLVVGDANEVPSDSCIALTLSSFRGTVMEQGCPPRCEGQAELDWAQTSQPSLVQQGRFLPDHFSDHKVLELFFPITPKDMSCGFLKSRPDWQKPAAADTKWWRDTLLHCWEGSQHSQFLNVASGSVDDNWNCFVTALEHMFRKAFQVACENEFATPQELARALRGPGLKGSDPVWRQRTLPRAGPSGPGSMPLRRLRRRVAQLYELRRHLTRSARASLQTAEAQKLSSRLALDGISMLLGCLLESFSCLPRPKAQLCQGHKDARRTTLANWQNHI